MESIYLRFYYTRRLIINKKFEFSVIGFILGCFYFFLSFVLLHEFWLGNPFESFSSILVTLYLGTCTWTFAYIVKELDRFDAELKKLGYTVFQGLSVVLYFAAPMVYIRLKFFGIEDEEKKAMNTPSSNKLEFSVVGFILGCFFFFMTFVFLHAAWLGNSFESLLSILVTVYLGVCTWTLSYTFKELDRTIDIVSEIPLGRILLIFVHLVLYFVSPAAFIWLKFFDGD